VLDIHIKIYRGHEAKIHERAQCFTRPRPKPMTPRLQNLAIMAIFRSNFAVLEDFLMKVLFEEFS